MKPQGAIAELSSLRSRHLLMAYFDYIRSVRNLRMSEAFANVARLPAPRFYVSANRAMVVLAKINSGDSLSDMRPLKREMFLEIHRRVSAFILDNPRSSLVEAIESTLARPAPSFYLSPVSVKMLILKARKSWFRKVSPKLPL